MMTPIVMTSIVQEDHRLILDLPDDIPAGTQVEVVVRPTDAFQTRLEAIRARLAEVGLLADVGEDKGSDVSDEELELLGTLPPGSPSSEQLIDEDRGLY